MFIRSSMLNNQRGQSSMIIDNAGICFDCFRPELCEALGFTFTLPGSSNIYARVDYY